MQQSISNLFKRMWKMPKVKASYRPKYYLFIVSSFILVLLF